MQFLFAIIIYMSNILHVDLLFNNLNTAVVLLNNLVLEINIYLIADTDIVVLVYLSH